MPSYFFSEEDKRWMPYRKGRFADMELDMPWTDRPLIRAKRFRQELIKKRPEAEGREVIDYALVVEPMTFAVKDPSAVNGRGPDIVLERGVIVEVMAPSDYDRKEIGEKAQKGVQVVSIRWHGRTRLVHGSMLDHASLSAFQGQSRKG